MQLGSLIVKVGIEGVERAKSLLDQLRGKLSDTADSSEEAGKRIGNGLSHGFESAIVVANNAIELFGRLSTVISAPFEQAVRMDNLMKGLTAVAGSASEAEKQFARLKEVAALPGLGLEEAVQGSIRLQAAGLSARTAERALKAFGNAIATVGGGKAELDGVTLALGQIAAKGKVSAEEINQLNERIPQIRQAMKAAFGTSDTEQLAKLGIDASAFIEGVVSQLERAKGVTGGIGNDVETFGDTVKVAMASLGRAIIPIAAIVIPVLARSIENVTPYIEGFAASVEKATSKGGLADFAKNAAITWETLKNAIALAGGAIAGFAAYRVIAGIILLTRTVMALVAAIRAVGLAAVVAKAVAGDWKGVAAGIAGAVAAIAAFSYISRGLGDVKIPEVKSGDGAVYTPQAVATTATSGGNMASALNASTSSKGNGGMSTVLSLMATAGALAIRNAMSGAGGDKGEQKRHLADIARNTGKTYDALSLRRQSFGGGELGRIGVTQAELSGGRGGGSGAPMGMAGGGYGYVGAASGDYVDQISELLRRAIHSRARIEVAAQSGASGQFRPR